MTYQEIEGKNCTITLEERPAWCDRGRFIAKVFQKDRVIPCFDDQDGFPRYYFFESHAKLELEQFLRFRDELITHEWKTKTA